MPGRPRHPTAAPARAGLTESAAARHYETAAATVGVAVPAQDLQQQYVPLWLRGAAATGIPTDVDPLSLSSTKPPFAAYNPVSADAVGRRRDSCTAYVEPVRHGVCRNNLEVVQAAVVTRIVVESGRAIGVDYLCAATHPSTLASHSLSLLAA